MAMFMTKGRMDYLLAQSLEKMPYSSLGSMGEALASEIQVRPPAGAWGPALVDSRCRAALRSNPGRPRHQL